MPRFLVIVVLALGASTALGPALAATAKAPPGATARCRDGTYSFSKHRSGTCSHHGGVAVWLNGSGGGGTHVRVGHTVLLAPRSRSAGCSLGARPDRRCSPGAYYSKLTRAKLCSRRFRTASIRNVSEGTRHAIEVEYGLAPRSYGRTLEVDHIVPLELGGSNNPANLFPEKAHPRGGAGYRAKDSLENAAHRLLCSGKTSLRTAQRAMAVNWERFYKKVFGMAPPR